MREIVFPGRHFYLSSYPLVISQDLVIEADGRRRVFPSPDTVEETPMNTSEPFHSVDIDTAGADSSLVGHRLACQRREQNITPAQQAKALSIDLERLTALCSCRMPRDMAGVEMIAARMGWEAERTAELLGMHTGG